MDSAALFDRAAAVRLESVRRVTELRAQRQSLYAGKLDRQLHQVKRWQAENRTTDAATVFPVHFDFPVIVIAASAGGLKPLLRIIGALPATGFPAAVLLIQHQSPGGRLTEFLAGNVSISLHDAADGDVLRPGVVLVCPPAHHARVEASGRVCVWAGERIGFVRPSADVAFTSLAETAGGRGIAVILSGSGSDGAMGSRAVRRAGGFVIAEHESSAAFPEMPTAAADTGHVDLILPADQIAPALIHLTSALSEPAPSVPKQP